MSRHDARLRELLRRHAEDGDESAIDELVAATRPKLLAVARRIGNPQDAEDSVQTAYLSLMRRGRPDVPILPWLVTAVVRIAYRRKATERRQHDLAHALARTQRETPARDALSAAERARLVRAQVARLPARYRDPIALRYLESLPTADIAVLLDLNEHTVRTRLRRGRALLRGPLAPAWMSALLALPWLARDSAAAAAGGFAVKKIAVAGFVLVVFAGFWTWRPRADIPRVKPDESGRTAMSTAPRGVEPTASATSTTPSKPGPGTRASRIVVAVRGDDGPVERFVVKLVRADGAVVLEQAGENGSAELAASAPGPHRVAVSAEGYAPWESGLRDTPQPVSVRLGRGVVYDITVLDERNRPVAGVSVQLIGPRSSGGKAKSDTRGLVSIGGILPVRGETLWYTAESPEHHPHGGNLPLPDTPGRETATIRLSRSVPLTVRVEDHAGKPVGAAAVTWSNAYPSLTRHYRTNAEGQVTFPMPHHIAGITIRARGPHGPPVAVRVSSREKPVATTIRLPRTDATLSGTIRYPDGTPAAGVQVGYTSDGEADGHGSLGDPLKRARFELRNLFVGRGRLHVRAPGFGRQTFDLELAAGEARRFDVKLHPGFVLEGTVVDSNGEPLPRTDVELRRMLPLNRTSSSYALLASTKSDANGRFRIEGLDDGSYRLHAGERVMTVHAGRAPVRVAPRDETVTLHVLDKSTGEPYSGRLTVDAGGWLAYPTPATAGVYRMGVPTHAESLDLTVTAPGYRPLELTGVRFDKTPVALKLALDPGAVLELRVLDERQRPVAGQALRTPQGVVRTDEDGRLRLPGLAPGEHDVQIGDPKNPLRFARVRTQAPGRADAVLQPWAKLCVTHVRKWSEVERAQWRVYDETGALVAEAAPQPYRMSNAHELRCFRFLYLPKSGRYHVVADLDGDTAEGTVDAVAGRETTLRLEVTKK